MTHTHFPHIAIIGLGLIGSSVARACKNAGIATTITAYDTNPLPLQLGESEGFISRGVSTIEEAVSQADLVVIAAPPTASMDMVPEIAAYVQEGTLITDVLSVKSPIAALFKQHFNGFAPAVPAHPIAGSEKTGAHAGRGDLLFGKRIILTPDTPEDAGIEDITAFWTAIGGVVEYMPPEVHDMVYASVSHLPQLLAFAYKPFASKVEGMEGLPPHFQQFTRLSHSDMYLWNDIFSHNKQHIDMALARFIVLLSHIRGELAASEEIVDKNQVPDVILWGHWLPRLIASCLIATLAQQSRDMGFNFTRFAGSGFKDFITPLGSEPEVDMEAISHHAPQMVTALDELLGELTKWVVIKD